MPRLSRIPADPSQRFFARVDRFVCECPKCGSLIHAYFDRVSRALPRGAKPNRARSSVYNPLTSRVSCPWCRRTWGVGLILYPVRERASGRQPADTQPTYAQLLALRRMGGGWLGQREIAGIDDVNIAVTADCTCPDKAWALDMACPVHGWEATHELLQEIQPAARKPSEDDS